MPHIHTLPDGRETGPDVVDPDNDQLHWHLVEGERTSSTAFGAGHTHTFDGAETSGPVEQNDDKAMVELIRALSELKNEVKSWWA